MDTETVSRVLLSGTVGPGGEICAGPVVAELDAAGRVVSYYPLEGHEPHSTVFLSGRLLETASMRII